MKGIMSALIIMTLTWLQAQEQTQNNRNGWFFGTAGGVSVVHLSTAGLSTENQSSLSFPNFKVGKMIRKTANNNLDDFMVLKNQ